MLIQSLTPSQPSVSSQALVRGRAELKGRRVREGGDTVHTTSSNLIISLKPHIYEHFPNGSKMSGVFVKGSL